MKSLPFTETVLLDKAASLRETADGYLVCNPRIARTGIQEYLGIEVGRPDLQKVLVYRPETEVFHADAVASLAHKPVTNEHPDEPVNASNWRDISVGHLGGEVLRDGQFVRVPLVLMDADAIKEVRDGKTQLSVGYSAALTWGDGETPTGEKYNAIQSEIRANHVAITRAARGGNKLRMGDNRRRTQERTMALRSFIVDGITVEMEERDLQVVERHLQKLENDIEAARTEAVTLRTASQADLAKAQTETANAAATVQTKDAEIVTLKKQLDDSKLTPQQLDKLVSDRVATVTRAKSILGDAVVVEGKTEADIRRQVVASKLGDVAKDWNDDMVTASFNTLTVADVGINGTRQVGEILQTQHANGTDPLAKAYVEYNEGVSNRWKTAGQHKAI